MPAATTNRFDIAIVGAGAAGLAAAQRLSAAGATVVLLEARARIGGRIWTRSRSGWPVPLELGPEFVHGRNEDLFACARDAGLPIVRLPEEHVERRGGRLRPMPDAWRRFDAITRTFGRSGRDQSVAEYLKARGRSLSAADRRLVVSFVEGYDAAPIEEASAHALSTAGDPPFSDDDREQFRLVNGYGPLVEGLFARIDSARCKLFLSTVVTRIAWNRDRVRLSTGRREFLAKKALVTVPVGVLRAAPGSRGSIVFDPEPPALRRAIDGLAMGDVVRLILRFRTPFWREASARRGFAEPNFFHLPSEAFPTWWTTAPVEAPVLTAWAGGPAASRLLRLAPGDILRRALETLARTLSVPATRVARNLLDWDLHDWTADPFARGAYSYARVGGASSGKRLGRPIAGTLHFAGEAIGSGETGTVPAALASGRRAARRMLR